MRVMPGLAGNTGSIGLASLASSSPLSLADGVAPPPPPPPSLSLWVRGILGNERERKALVVFNGRLEIISPGQEIPNLFKVKEIRPTEVVVTFLADGSIKTFALE